jgi:hypothetical protein
MGAARGIAGSMAPEENGVFLCRDEFEARFFTDLNNTGGQASELPAGTAARSPAAVSSRAGSGRLLQSEASANRRGRSRHATAERVPARRRRPRNVPAELAFDEHPVLALWAQPTKNAVTASRSATVMPT